MNLCRTGALLSVLLAGSVISYAQGNVLVKGGTKIARAANRSIPWQKAVRMGGLSYMVPSAQLGAETLRGANRSIIGTPEHIRMNRVASLLSPLGTNLSHIIADKLVKPSDKLPVNFSGYYPDFPKSWQQFVARTNSHGGRLEVILEAAYGEAHNFFGRFVATFDEVVALAGSPVKHPVSAREALNQALTQAEDIKHGFFVIQVVGNEHRPKDTLLLDLKNSTYISYNKSKANAWAKAIDERTRESEPHEGRDAWLDDWRRDPSIIDRRATQGIILRINGKSMMPKDISVSLTGNSWIVFHLNAKDAYTSKELEQGINIWTAWNKGYYILADMGQNRYLFASEPGKPLFATTREVDEYLRQQKQ